MGRRKIKNVAWNAHEGDMQWHLQWCRRREEDASVLVMQLPATDLSALHQIVAEFRVTDSVRTVKAAGGFEIHAVIDDHGLSRAALEERFVGACSPLAPRFGWASFPRDGLTLDVLIGEARRSTCVIETVHPQTTPDRKGNVERPEIPVATHLQPVDA